MTLEETWLERVLTWRASGLSATAFCEGAEFGAGALRSWSSRFGREGKVSRSPLGRQSKKAGAGVRFARVVTAATEPEPPPEPGAAALASHAAPSVVVALGQARIEVSAGFDPSLLRAVVVALEGGSR